MAAQHADESDEDEFHSLSGKGDGDSHDPELHASSHVAAEEDADDDAHSDDGMISPPTHPIPAFQDAFEESIVESIEGTEQPDATDADMRRRRPLEAERYDDKVTPRWRQRPGGEYHTFVKLIAQIVFGMHLLKEGQAKSNEEVVKILQNHVNEVDAFLEKTAEDFDLAIKDIEERVRHLKLPMQHMDTFQVMLEEKKFRNELVEGNERIEKIIEKTNKAMSIAMLDVQNGTKSTKELSRYLTRVEGQWPKDNREIAEVFTAMRGNEEGWAKYLRHLRTKGDNLKDSLVVLETVIAQISKHAAAASRKNKTQEKTLSPTSTKKSGSPPLLRSRFAKESPRTVYRKPGPWLDKPLPQEPNALPGAQQAAMVKPHPIPLTERYEQPRQRVPAPTPRSSGGNESSSRRWRAFAADANTRELSDFLRDLGPLRSHPPDSDRDVRSDVKRMSRSVSHGGRHALTIPQDMNPRNLSRRNTFRRSQSQGVAATSNEQQNKTRYIPRTSSGSAPSKTDHKDEGPPSALDNRKDWAAYEFSRRISRKLKGIEAPKLSYTTSINRKDISSPRPIDSAHSSNAGKDLFAIALDKQPTNADLEKEAHVSPELEQRPSLASGHSTISKEPSSVKFGHSLFPSVGRPLTPSQAVNREHVDSPERDLKAYLSRSDSSPPASPPQIGKKGHRALSFRSLFRHRKNGEARNVAVS